MLLVIESWAQDSQEVVRNKNSQSRIGRNTTPTKVDVKYKTKILGLEDLKWDAASQ
jgi:hypothetical protein